MKKLVRDKKGIPIFGTSGITLLVAIDGSCLGNPGPGGWAVVILNQLTKEKRVRYGHVKNVSPNRAELIAALQAVKWLREEYRMEKWNQLRPVTILTDSKYILRGIEKTNRGPGNEFRCGRAGRNRELWHELLKMNIPCRIRWRWVPAHAGHELNEEADQLASFIARDPDYRPPTKRISSYATQGL